MLGHFQYVLLESRRSSTFLNDAERRTAAQSCDRVRAFSEISGSGGLNDLIINNIGFICDHHGGLCGPLCACINLGALGADAEANPNTGQGHQRGYTLFGHKKRYRKIKSDLGISFNLCLNESSGAQRPTGRVQMITMLLTSHPRRIRLLSAGLHGSPRISTGRVTQLSGTSNSPSYSSERPMMILHILLIGTGCSLSSQYSLQESILNLGFFQCCTTV